MCAKSGLGAPWMIEAMSMPSATPERSIFMPLRSMPFMSRPEMSSPAPIFDVSNLNAPLMAASSTENMLPRSTPFLVSLRSSSKVLPVKMSTLGFASCCFTMSELAARCMSSVVRPCV